MAMYHKHTFSFYLKRLFISIKNLARKRIVEVMCEKLKKLGIYKHKGKFYSYSFIISEKLVFTWKPLKLIRHLRF